MHILLARRKATSGWVAKHYWVTPATGLVCLSWYQPQKVWGWPQKVWNHAEPNFENVWNDAKLQVVTSWSCVSKKNPEKTQFEVFLTKERYLQASRNIFSPKKEMGRNLIHIQFVCTINPQLQIKLDYANLCKRSPNEIQMSSDSPPCEILMSPFNSERTGIFREVWIIWGKSGWGSVRQVWVDTMELLHFMESACLDSKPFFDILAWIICKLGQDLL